MQISNIFPSEAAVNGIVTHILHNERLNRISYRLRLDGPDDRCSFVHLHVGHGGRRWDVVVIRRTTGSHDGPGENAPYTGHVVVAVIAVALHFHTALCNDPTQSLVNRANG